MTVEAMNQSLVNSTPPMRETKGGRPISRSVLATVLFLGCYGMGIFLAYHHPLSPGAAVLGFMLASAVAFMWPSAWLIAVPAILPLFGLAPWTGWLVFEEFDLVVLAVAAGGYARIVLKAAKAKQKLRLSLVSVILMGAFAISLLISMSRGFDDAGGFVFGWFHGYDAALNSFRIAKSYFLALLLCPLMIRALGEQGEQATKLLAAGLAVGLGVVCLAALWERLAFTGLLDFSSDYRTTALFWEMHVGGAALDGFLALTIPFAIWGVRKSATQTGWLVSFCLLCLAVYASLTTFSRGLYFALALAITLLLWQLRRESSSESRPALAAWGSPQWVLATAWCLLTAALVFPSSGYRGLLALLGVIACALPLAHAARKAGLRLQFVGMITGVVLGGGGALLAGNLPKGPYIFYATVLVCALFVCWSSSRGARPAIAAVASSLFVVLLISATNVAAHWGGEKALLDFLWASAIIVGTLAWAIGAKKPLWPNTPGWYRTILVVAVVSSGVTAVLAGGAYMGDRIANTSKDLNGRIEHWSQALAMLTSPADVVVGKGLGRFSSNYFFSIQNGEFPGTYRIGREGENQFLTLTGGRHVLGFGEILRVSQRLTDAAGQVFDVSLKARAKESTVLHLEICEKHLIYNSTCAVKQVQIKPSDSEWTAINVQLDGQNITGGPWYAPKLIAFSIGLESKGSLADIDDLALTAHNGQNWLVNGDFSEDMAHWFFTSDKHHLPWHAKNILLNILFDQGAIGVILFAALIVVAFMRLSRCRIAGRQIAPYVTAGLVAFLVVGLFDSLLDAPRLAFIFYLLVLYALVENTREFPAISSRPRGGRAASSS